MCLSTDTGTQTMTTNAIYTTQLFKKNMSNPEMVKEYNDLEKCMIDAFLLVRATIRNTLLEVYKFQDEDNQNDMINYFIDSNLTTQTMIVCGRITTTFRCDELDIIVEVKPKF